MKEREQHW